LEPNVHELQGYLAASSIGRIQQARGATILSTADRKRLEHVEGTVFNLQRDWLDGGSSVCTSIYLKGCPLRCAWCASSESQRFKPELLMFAAKCTS
jgi:hypothetical protein